MLKCKVCGKEFEAVKENHYIAREGIKTGALANLASNEEKIFDAFDCPYCGCQYIAGERKREQKVLAISENEEQNKNEEQEESDYRPYCFGNCESSSSVCAGCVFLTKCMKESELNRKEAKNPACFGKYEEENIGCREHCSYRQECKENTKEVKEKCVICDECEKEKDKSRKPTCFGFYDDYSDECVMCPFDKGCEEKTKKAIKPKKPKKGN